MTFTSGLGWIAVLLLVVAITIFAFYMAVNPSALPPEMGSRGLKRAKAMKDGGTFAMLEPVMRFIAGRIAVLPVDGLRKRAREHLENSGDYLGLDANEYLALSLVGAVGGLAAGVVIWLLAETTGLLPFMATVGGAMMTYLQVQGEIERRFKQVNRGLPYAIDLAALAMGAGLDFPGALRQVTEKAPDREDALIEELTRVLNEIDLGRTRRQALESFQERTPTESVKDFVAAVIQSEEKGNPLADVLTIQANVLRMRRSVAAEENAAKAGLMMMGPMMLIFACIMLLMMGPFIVTFSSGGIM